jgi:thioesterase domain-containing protein/acyl carrier protein
MVRYVNNVELQRGVVSIESADTPISSCGKVPAGSDVRIVDPTSLEECAADKVGEVWVHAATMGSGYWGRPELSQETFNARIAGDASGKPYLRTGDLGFMMDNQLFVIGRIKDTIIVRGRNVEPADIERAVNEVADANLRAGCAAAFSLEGNDEPTVVVVCEVRQPLSSAAAYRSLAQRIRASVMSHTHTFVNNVCFAPAGRVAKTTSGKIRRRATSKAFSEGALKLLYSDDSPTSYVVNACAVTLEDVISQTLHEATNMVVAPDDPFESFMDSLQFVQFVSLLSKRLSVRLELNVFSDHNTITLLDEYLQQEHSAAVSRALSSSFETMLSENHSVIPHNLQTGGGKTPMFLLPPFLGFYTYELFLAAYKGDRPTYVLVQSPQHASRSLQELARSYVDVIRSVQPNGPYIIGGYSFGASLALCVAKMLDRSEIEAVVCVDDVHRPLEQLGHLDQDWRSLLRAVVSFMKLSAKEQQSIDALLTGDGHSEFESITQMVESLEAQAAGQVEQMLTLKVSSLKQLCYHLRCYIRNLALVRGAHDTLDHERGYAESYLGKRAILVYSCQDNPHQMAGRFAQSIPIDGTDHFAIVSPEQVAGYWPRVCRMLDGLDRRVEPRSQRRSGRIGHLWERVTTVIRGVHVSE